jgi:phosphate:Na+ symporter
MAEIAKEILMKSKEAILKERLDLVEKIKLKENMIDELHHLIDNYLTKISALDLTKKEAEKVTLFLHVVSDIERVGDHSDNFAEFTEIKVKK